MARRWPVIRNSPVIDFADAAARERGQEEPFERARYGECRISATLLTANRPRWRFIGDELFLSRRRGSTSPVAR